MAYSGTVTRAYHGTAGTAPDTINFGRTAHSIKLLNRGSVDIYYTIGSFADPAPTPTVAGLDCYIVSALERSVEATEAPVNQIKLVAAANCVYSVEAHF